METTFNLCGVCEGEFLGPHQTDDGGWRCDAHYIEVLKSELAELQKKIDDATCHRGHSDYPLTLWDCPVCVEIEKKKVEAQINRFINTRAHEFTEMMFEKFKELGFKIVRDPLKEGEVKVDKGELDRHITGNYGEDQFKDCDEMSEKLSKRWQKLFDGADPKSIVGQFPFPLWGAEIAQLEADNTALQKRIDELEKEHGAGSITFKVGGE